jgi:hypothetical protein
MSQAITAVRRRRTPIALVGVLVLLAGVIFIANDATAVNATGAFELDGNATTNHGAGAPDDWDRVCHQVLGTDCSTTSNTTSATAVSWVSEPNLNSTIFTGGGSKDPIDISSWAWKDGAGGLPDKDNLLNSFAARYTLDADAATCPGATATATVCDVLFFGSDRYDNSGDAQQGFWFFQNKITTGTAASGGGFNFDGVHKNGDLLIISDFSNGGTTSIITIYAWNTACTKAGLVLGNGNTCGDNNLERLKAPSESNCATSTATSVACGIVNPDDGTTSPWSFTDKSGNSTYLQGEFYEGGVNLSKLGLGGECFASVMSETRSSQSTTAVLKDFVLGGFGDCSTHVTTTPKDGSGGAIPSGGLSITTGTVQATDSAQVVVNGTPTWSGTVDFWICGPITTPTTCNGTTTATVGVSIGSKPVSNTTPTVASDAANLTSVGRYCWRGVFTPDTATAAKGVPSASDSSTGECFTVAPVTPTLSTQAGTSPVDLGQPVTDTATLSGTATQPGTNGPNSTYPSINATNGAPAGGTITFTLVGPDSCTTTATVGSGESNPLTSGTVSGDGSYGPVSLTPQSPGAYHWKASYAPASGDPNNLATSHNASCTDGNEDVTVNQVQPEMTTAQRFLPNDSASITAPGGGALSGSVKFELYEGSTCTGSIVYETTKTVSASGTTATVSTDNTTTYIVTTSKTLSWKVSYKSNNPAQKDIAASCKETSSVTIDNG